MVLVKIQMSNPGPSWTSWAGMNLFFLTLQFYAKKAGLLTIVPKDPEYTDIIGKGKTISFQDARIVNAMYKCSGMIKCLQVYINTRPQA